MAIDHKEDLKFKNGRGNIERLIVFTSFDYIYQFMETLHAMGSKLWTQEIDYIGYNQFSFQYNFIGY